MYEIGEGVPKDDAKNKQLEKRASELIQRACAAGKWEHCFSAATDKAHAKDISGALEMYRSACDQGDATSCRFVGSFLIGDLTVRGQTVRPDEAKAKEYFTRACKLRNRIACKKMKEQGWT